MAVVSWKAAGEVAEVPQAPQKRVSDLFVKTRKCRFHGLGQCSRGALCTFAHSGRDLRQAPDLSRTKVCPAVLAGGEGSCSDVTCKYAHSREDRRKLPGDRAAARPTCSALHPEAASKAMAQELVAPVLVASAQAHALHAPEAAVDAERRFRPRGCRAGRRRVRRRPGEAVDGLASDESQADVADEAEESRVEASVAQLGGRIGYSLASSPPYGGFPAASRACRLPLATAGLAEDHLAPYGVGFWSCFPAPSPVGSCSTVEADANEETEHSSPVTSQSIAGTEMGEPVTVKMKVKNTFLALELEQPPLACRLRRVLSAPGGWAWAFQGLQSAERQGMPCMSHDVGDEDELEVGCALRRAVTDGAALHGAKIVQRDTDATVRRHATPRKKAGGGEQKGQLGRSCSEPWADFDEFQLHGAEHVFNRLATTSTEWAEMLGGEEDNVFHRFSTEESVVSAASATVQLP